MGSLQAWKLLLYSKSTLEYDQPRYHIWTWNLQGNNSKSDFGQTRVVILNIIVEAILELFRMWG